MGGQVGLADGQVGVRVSDRLVSGGTQRLRFLSIGGAETFLPLSTAVFEVKDPRALVEPVTMFHKHLHSVCEVLENRLRDSRRARRSYAKQWWSSTTTGHFPGSFPGNPGFFHSHRTNRR